MVETHGLQTSIKELKNISNEYKNQLKRMKVKDIDDYPIIINIVNDTNEKDEWKIERES